MSARIPGGVYLPPVRHIDAHTETHVNQQEASSREPHDAASPPSRRFERGRISPFPVGESSVPASRSHGPFEQGRIDPFLVGESSVPASRSHGPFERGRIDPFPVGEPSVPATRPLSRFVPGRINPFHVGESQSLASSSANTPQGERIIRPPLRHEQHQALPLSALELSANFAREGGRGHDSEETQPYTSLPVALQQSADAARARRHRPNFSEIRDSGQGTPTQPSLQGHGTVPPPRYSTLFVGNPDELPPYTITEE